MNHKLLRKMKHRLLDAPITIREAALDDLFSMTELLSELFNIEADFTPNLAHQREGLAALMASRNCTLLVAVSQCQIVGMCTLQPLISTAEGGAVGMVEDLIVAEKFRHRGVGLKLLQGIEQVAQERGMLRLQLLTDKDEITETFFNKTGWKPTQLIVKRKLLRQE